MSDGVGRRHTLLCVSASVLAGDGGGNQRRNSECSKMSAPMYSLQITLIQPLKYLERQSKLMVSSKAMFTKCSWKLQLSNFISDFGSLLAL